MSRNTLLVLTLSALVLAAAGARVAFGPSPGLAAAPAAGSSAYAQAKVGVAPAWLDAPVQMASGEARPAN